MTIGPTTSVPQDPRLASSQLRNLVSKGDLKPEEQATALACLAVLRASHDSAYQFYERELVRMGIDETSVASPGLGSSLFAISVGQRNRNLDFGGIDSQLHKYVQDAILHLDPAIHLPASEILARYLVHFPDEVETWVRPLVQSNLEAHILLATKILEKMGSAADIHREKLIDLFMTAHCDMPRSRRTDLLEQFYAIDDDPAPEFSMGMALKPLFDLKEQLKTWLKQSGTQRENTLLNLEKMGRHHWLWENREVAQAIVQIVQKPSWLWSPKDTEVRTRLIRVLGEMNVPQVWRELMPFRSAKGNLGQVTTLALGNMAFALRAVPGIEGLGLTGKKEADAQWFAAKKARLVATPSFVKNYFGKVLDAFAFAAVLRFYADHVDHAALKDERMEALRWIKAHGPRVLKEFASVGVMTESELQQIEASARQKLREAIKSESPIWGAEAGHIAAAFGYEIGSKTSLAKPSVLEALVFEGEPQDRFLDVATKIFMKPGSLENGLPTKMRLALSLGRLVRQRQSQGPKLSVGDKTGIPLHLQPNSPNSGLKRTLSAAHHFSPNIPAGLAWGRHLSVFSGRPSATIFMNRR